MAAISNRKAFPPCPENNGTRRKNLTQNEKNFQHEINHIPIIADGAAISGLSHSAVSIDKMAKRVRMVLLNWNAASR
jgi:hypothetical protein